jgi:hypothetical protein
MADGSPTSGGTSDNVTTADTWAETGSGTPPIAGTRVVVAGGSLRRVTGEKAGNADGGNVQPGNELDVTDRRMGAMLGWVETRLRVSLERIVLILSRGATVQPRQAGSVRVRGVAASLTSVELVFGMKGRLGLRITNDTSSGVLFCKQGDAPATSANGGYSFVLNPGDYWEATQDELELPVQGVWGTATGFANVTEKS